MDKILEKFGIYDFMGVWGPGAISSTYFYYTMGNYINKLLKLLDISPPSISTGNRLFIFYTVVSYVVGVVLHEISKLLVERITYFHPQEVKKIAYSGEISDKCKYYKIKKEYKDSIEDSIDEENYQNMKFDKCVCYLKYINKMGTARVDKYHSVYALARSLFVCFLAHAVIYFCITIVVDIVSWKTCILIAFDLVMFYIFWERTYRYFCSWVRNVFIQCYLMQCSRT